MHMAASFPTAQVWSGREHHKRCKQQVISSGIAQLDNWLPHGGWQKGSIVECLLPVNGFGEMELLLPLMSRLSREHSMALIGMPWEPHALGWLQRGVALERLCFVATQKDSDAMRVVEQALECRCFSLVVAWVGGSINNSQWQRMRQSLQGQSGMLWLMRPYERRQELSAADCRLGLTPDHGVQGLCIHPLRFRGKVPVSSLRWKPDLTGTCDGAWSFAF